MQAPNKKAAPFSFHRCVLFVIFKPNFSVDSLNSNFHFFPAESMETGDEIKSCSRSLPRTTDQQQLQNAVF